MAQFTLPEDLARRLNEVARREQRPVEEIIEAMLDRYTAPDEESGDQANALLSIAGMFDMGPTDLAAEVKKMRHQHYEHRDREHK